MGGAEAQNILAAKVQRQEMFLVSQGSVMELHSFCYFKPVLGDAAIYLNWLFRNSATKKAVASSHTKASLPALCPLQTLRASGALNNTSCKQGTRQIFAQRPNEYLSIFALLFLEEFVLSPSSSLGDLGFAGPVPISSIVKSLAPCCLEKSRATYLAAMSAVTRRLLGNSMWIFFGGGISVSQWFFYFHF